MSQHRFVSRAAFVSLAMGGSIIALTGTAFATAPGVSSFTIEAPPVVNGVVEVSTPGQLIYIDDHQLDPIQAGSVTSYLAATIDLENNIDMKGYTGWTPMGSSPITGVAFSGIFNGQGYKVSNFSIEGSTENTDVGFFGGCYGTVKNLGLVGTVESTSAMSNVGGLAGDSEGGSIDNCYFIGSVTAPNANNVGGLAGFSTNYISDSYTTGSVNGIAPVGGLVGSQQSGTITGSYSSTSVQGNGNGGTGGLVGSLFGGVDNSFATGSVSGSIVVGGLVGWAVTGSITNTYATGKVSSSSGSVTGALVGHLGSYVGSASISKSFFDKSTGQSNGTGWLQSGSGSATQEPDNYMKLASTFTAAPANWDFTNTWGINSNINNGYPYLQVFYPNGVQGQLPEVPFAGTLPFIGLAGVGAFIFARKRKNVNRFAN